MKVAAKGKMPAAARAFAVVFAGVAALLVAMGGIFPAHASDYLPAPPAGWRMTVLAEVDQASDLQAGDGVLTAPTEPADPRSVTSFYDVYRLGAERMLSGPATSVLPGYIKGIVFAVDAGWVLYGSLRPGSDPDDRLFDLYLRELGTGRTVPVPLSPGLRLDPNGPPRLSQGRVVWSQFGPGHEPEVMLFDVVEGTVKRLSQGTEAQGTADISGDHVVWQAWNGVSYRVLDHKISTGETRELASDVMLSRSLGVQVDRGRAIWAVVEQSRQGAAQEWLYVADVETGRTQVALTSSGTITGELGGDLLVTSVQEEGATAKLAVRDLAGGQSRVLDDSMAQPVSFSVGDGVVAWAKVQLPTKEGGNLNQIKVFDAAKDETVVVATGEGLWQPRADGARVAFIQADGEKMSRIWVAEQETAAPYEYYLDVLPSDAYYEGIVTFGSRGLVSGYGTGTFRVFHPSYPLLRAQLAKIVCHSLGLAVDEWMALPTPFRDLGPDDPAQLFPHEYITAAAGRGLMQGYAPGLFGPWASVTRAELVSVVVRAIRLLSPELLQTPPADYVPSVTGAPPVHADNLRIAEFNGLLHDISGFGPGWDVNAPAVRGQAVQMLYGATRDLIAPR